MDSEGLTDDLFKKKLDYPFEKFNLDNFQESISLNKEHYWSTLTQSYQSHDDIPRTNEITKTYNITTPQQLTMLYLKMDVLQITDVIENFVETSTLVYGINPLYSYSAPGYTWKAGFTIVKLDYIKDGELLLILENSIHGGLSNVLGDKHVKSDENTKLLFIDVNNL